MQSTGHHPTCLAIDARAGRRTQQILWPVGARVWYFSSLPGIPGMSGEHTGLPAWFLVGPDGGMGMSSDRMPLSAATASDDDRRPCAF